MPENESTTGAGRTVKVKYDSTTAQYASQVILNASPEEIFLDFSSGAITDPGTGETLVPIHTRIAMSAGGARRLAELLNKALAPREGGTAR